MGCRLGEQTYVEFANAVAGTIKRCDDLTIRASLEDIRGEVLRLPAWYPIAWRLAGNLERLRAGRPVMPWTRQTTDEWIVCEIEDIRRVRRGTGKYGYNVKCLALTGSCCPMRLETYWPQSFFGLVRTRLGFSRKQPFRYPFNHWSELTQMRFEALLTPELCATTPQFRQLRETSILLKYNRELTLRRTRVKFACPQNYEHKCCVCPVGIDGCPVATHAKTYKRSHCRHCGRDAWFDSGFRAMCVECRRRKDEEQD
jgi:hypothetical protein